MRGFFKLFIFSFFLLVLEFIIIPSFSSPADAQFVGCWVTKIGNPSGPSPTLSPECASQAGQAVVNLGRQHLAGSYIWYTPAPRDWAAFPPSNAPTHFDCSGFAGWVWYWATNGRVYMHGQTDGDWFDKSGKYIKYLAKDQAQLQPGDLVYFGTLSSVHHVGIFEGPGACGKTNCFLEWYTTGEPGRSNSLSNEPDFVGFLRPVLN